MTDGEHPRQRRRGLLPPDPRQHGSDPDYRFTLANERTFLAWIRTSLALAAGGLGSVALLDDFRGVEFVGIGLLVLSVVSAGTSYRRWALSETAIRMDQPLPKSRLPLVVAFTVSAIAVVSAVLVLVNTT